jgi:hypothetical protein
MNSSSVITFGITVFCMLIILTQAWSDACYDGSEYSKFIRTLKRYSDTIHSLNESDTPNIAVIVVTNHLCDLGWKYMLYEASLKEGTLVFDTSVDINVLKYLSIIDVDRWNPPLKNIAKQISIEHPNIKLIIQLIDEQSIGFFHQLLYRLLKDTELPSDSLLIM